ncbi:MAG: DegT/DnrJ/EryC1/StrS family aminotransferase, partial [Hymenobacteraceae bacterium]|nr:DegT/DnrJ/EryC1/StrS family aminotransferase [Hymenobacteraceae bacterium]MDX5395813.1 DegT/DnrJ/EryC1/StrS family aminotransferase [Hymenobacteraceae bacterium]MDX5442343.1 DegT/DnrJ/EryC1/StrS family aminotransferase [Hymenobacteraceae bacterium]MDX5511868.1 DegT/DnrJ/EryC1/StrS family aminotransferase [Hymenobacteraceae bacterium]
DFLQIKHVIPCGNGTDALQIALMALDLPEGAEVIVPAFNYVATAEVIALLKLKPVFADVLPNTFTLDVASAKEKITDKTAAIMPVHLFGQCADMDAVMALAKEHDLYVIEDNAQAIGAKYISGSGEKATAGGIGHIGTTSFFPSKNLGCMGDGGAIFTNDDALANKLQTIANHGQAKKYVFSTIGVNSRLDTLQAAILRVKLQHLGQYIESRQKAASVYDEFFKDAEHIQTPVRAPYSTHVFHQYTLKVPALLRDALKLHLQEKGIPSMVYYPIPLHLQEAYQYLGYKKGDFPVSEALCEQVLSLPMHTELSHDQQQFISETVLSFLKKQAVSV